MVLEGQDDCDLFGYYQEGSQLALEVFAMRSGRVVGRREFFWEDLISFDPSEFLSQAVNQYYLQDTFTPKEIYLPADIEDSEVLESWLSERKGSRVYIRSPRQGLKSEMLDLVMRNAHISFDTRFRILKPRGEELLKPFQDILGLESLPRRIETFDISHVQGTDTVASMVVCINGEMKRNGYRKFKIESVKGPDDLPLCARLSIGIMKTYWNRTRGICPIWCSLMEAKANYQQPYQLWTIWDWRVRQSPPLLRRRKFFF